MVCQQFSQVFDGRLTLSNAAGAKNNKINFIDIKAAAVGSVAGPLTDNLPINSAPPPLFNSSSPSSSGFGGINPPSYQVSLTGGKFPRAMFFSPAGRDGNSYTVIVALGYEARLNGVEMVSMLEGYPRFNAHIE